MRDALDPDLATLVEDFEAHNVPDWHEMDVEEARTLEDDLFSPDEDALPPVGDVRDTTVPGPDGAVPVRIYTPDTQGPHPLLVFCHGGGWMLGTLDSADDLCRNFCTRADRIVVSVDYHLAPEHRFPAGLADAISVLVYCADGTGSLPPHTDDIAVAGTSAGGNLATGLARYSVEHSHLPVVSRQLLCYPMIEPGQNHVSYRENDDAPFLVPGDVAWFWEHYLRHDVDEANPYAVPTHAPNYANLPPTTIVTAGHDPLRDEAISYTDRLDAAGVEVAHLHYPSLCHGFLSLTDSVVMADEAFDELVATLD